MNAQPSGSPDSGKDSLSSFIQMKYGLDQELFNGFQYYKRYIKYKGDPFFPEDSFYEGSVCIRGVEFDNVRLKYNSYSQYLILEYTDYQERYNQLKLNNAQIDSFQLGAYGFQKLSLFGEEPLFYQVLCSGAIICYIHWAKNIHATSDDLQYSYEYSRPLGTFHLSYKGEIQTFNKRKTFISILPVSMQAEIKKYFRQQRLSFREAGPGDIQKLIVYVSQLGETLSEH
ncbi:MAG: hypothetical protein KAT15_31170 [Bacteroidales bacterium]|nr:hypothetical protein [Bacteroidales bacterium]